MRIAFFTDSYLPNTDGVVTHITTYRKLFEKMGHEVYIFAPGTKKQKEENKDPKVHYFTSASFKPYPDYRLALFPFPSTTQIIKELKPDIIHSHGIATTGIAAFQSAKKIKAPAVATFHTLVSDATHYIIEKEEWKGVLEGIIWKYLKWYYEHFDKVIVPSKFAQNILEKHGINKTIVMSSGVDVKKFSKKIDCDFIFNKYEIKGPVVLFVGRIVKEKNLELLIDAAYSVVNKIPHAKFIVAGKGPAENYYKEMVALKGLNEHFVFTGFVPEKELITLYKVADVFAFPSKFDTQGLVVLESLASGTPAVVFQESAAAEFVENEVNGYVFKDIQDFPEKIIRAIENKEKLSENAIKKAREFDVRKKAKEMIEFYEYLINKKTR